MRRHRPLHSQHTQSSRAALEEDDASDASHRQPRTTGTLWHSNGSDDGINGSRGNTAGTAAAASPHLSCSPIPFYSAHASTLSSASESTTRMRPPRAAALPQPFYDGTSLRDGIPALLQHFTRQLEKPASPPASAPDASAAARESVHPLIVPQPPQQQLQRRPPTSSVSSERLRDRVRPGTQGGNRVNLPDRAVRSSLHVASSATRNNAVSYVAATATAAAAPPPAQYVLVQRRAAAHVLPRPSKGPDAPPAGTKVPTRRYRAVPSHSSGSEPTTDYESYGSGSRSSASAVEYRRDANGFVGQPARSQAASLSSSSASSSLSAHHVASARAQHKVAQASSLPGRPAERAQLSHTSAVSGPVVGTPPSPSPPSHKGTVSSASNSPPRQQPSHSSRMRSLLASVLSRSNSADGERAGPARGPVADERRPGRSAAPGHARRIVSPLTASPLDASTSSQRKQRAWAVAPATAAVQDAGDPLVLRHTIDYLLAKAHRLERENAQLWWQTHSWDPHRELDPREAPVVAAPPHHSPHLRHRSGSSRRRSSSPRPHPAAGTSQATVFVRRQPRVSLGVGRSASEVAASASTSSSSAAPAPHCSGGLAMTARPSLAGATGPVRRVDAGAQSRSGAAAASPPPVRDSLDAEGAADLAGAASPTAVAADSLRAVAPTHVDAAAQTDSVTPLQTALRSLTPNELSTERLRSARQADRRHATTTTAAATPMVSTVRSHRSLDSRRSLGTMAALSSPPLPFPSLAGVAPREQQQQQRSPSGSPSLPSRPSTHSKQVQTASILSPAAEEAEDVLPASATDGGAGSQLSSDRTAVIELHTAAAYTSHTVRRLRNYCGALEATRLQLRRRLSASSVPASRAASHLTSPVSGLHSRHPRLPLPPPAASAVAPLRRPFFTTEYADPEVDATLHDVEEMAAVETMIVLQEDGAGTVTKRVVDGSPSRVSSPGARSSSLTSHYALPGEGGSVSALGLRHPPAHRQQPRRQLLRPAHLTPHAWRDTTTSVKSWSGPAALREGQRRTSHSSLRSDATGSDYVPVVVLGRAARSTSATSWNTSEALTYSPDVTPLAALEYGAAAAHAPPPSSRFVLPPVTPSEGGDESHLEPPTDHPAGPAAAAVAAWPPHPSSTPPPHKSSTAPGSPGLALDPPTTSVSVSASAAPHTTVNTTGSTTRTNSATPSQRFAVRGRSESAAAAERDIPSRAPSRSSSLNSDVSSAPRKPPHGATGRALHAGAADSPREPRSSSPPAASAGGRFAVPVGRSRRPHDSDAATASVVPLRAPPGHITSSTACLSPLTPPAAALEAAAEPPAPLQVRSPLRLDSGKAHDSAPVSPEPSAPVHAVAHGGARRVRSTTTVFVGDGAGHDGAATTGAASPPFAEAGRASARLAGVDAEVESADGADSFHSSLPPLSPRSSSSGEQGAGGVPGPSRRRRAPGPLVSPSPPRAHVQEINAAGQLMRAPVADVEKSAAVSPPSSRGRRAVLPLERPPVAPPRVVVMPRDASSTPPSPDDAPSSGGGGDSDTDSRGSSSQWKSLHTVSSGQSGEDERGSSVSSESSVAPRHSAWF